MIFKAVTELSDRKEKNFFIEKIKVYVRIVSISATREGDNIGKVKDIFNSDIGQELSNLGVIAKSELKEAEGYERP